MFYFLNLNIPFHVLLSNTCFCLQVGGAFNWTSSSPDNNASYYSCVGDNITLPWSYITDYHETVSYIEWYFSETSGTSVFKSSLVPSAEYH